MEKIDNNTKNNKQDGLPAAPARASHAGGTNTAQAGKFLEGVVVKSAMKDTVTVQVERYVKHPKYKKYVRKSKKFLVHNPGNTAEIGQKVTIRETRPISKNKHFIIVK